MQKRNGINSSNAGSINAKLSDIATDLVLKKAIEDKVASCTEEKQRSDADALETPNDEPQELDTDDLDLKNLREVRLQRLKASEAQRKKFLQDGGGSYDLVDEAEFLKIATTTEKVICHFFHREFEKCKIMDFHLAKIAKLRINTRILRVDVEKSPFLTSKLAIRVLPTIVVLHNGIATGRIVGFEGLSKGNEETFKTDALIKLLGALKALKTAQTDESDEDEDDDKKDSSG